MTRFIVVTTPLDKITSRLNKVYTPGSGFGEAPTVSVSGLVNSRRYMATEGTVASRVKKIYIPGEGFNNP